MAVARTARGISHSAPPSRTRTSWLRRRHRAGRLRRSRNCCRVGNPQIAKADGDAPVQAYITAMPEWKGDVGRYLDSLIGRLVPDVKKAVRWNTPFYGVDGRGWFLGFHCFTKYVKVTFLRGASLRPPPPVTSKHEHHALRPHPRGRGGRRGPMGSVDHPGRRAGRRAPLLVAPRGAPPRPSASYAVTRFCCVGRGALFHGVAFA